MQGVAENELCPVYAGWLAPRAAVRLAADEVAESEWVPWGRFVDQVTSGQAVSQWCREQVDELAALGPDPKAWTEADDALLPPAARLG